MQVQRVHCVNEPVCVIFTLLRYFAFAFLTIATITFENANADVNPKCEWVLMIPISCLTKGGTVANTKYTKIYKIQNKIYNKINIVIEIITV